MDPEDLEAEIREQEAAGDRVIIIQPSPAAATDTAAEVAPSSDENTPIVIQPHATNGTSGPAVIQLPDK